MATKKILGVKKKIFDGLDDEHDVRGTASGEAASDALRKRTAAGEVAAEHRAKTHDVCGTQRPEAIQPSVRAKFKKINGMHHAIGVKAYKLS